MSSASIDRSSGTTGRFFHVAASVCLLLAGALTSCRPPAANQATDSQTEPASEAAEETPTLGTETTAPTPEPTLNAAAQELNVRKGAQVSILGYHDFTVGKSSNPMVINVDKFRQQMQAIKDAKIKVISMSDYLAWRKGEKDIPADPALMITIDDGWKSVHTLALPVLKEFGYPFTVFLYKNFVNGGGRALNTAEIKELMENGATVGSHSVSHPFPGEFKRRAKGIPADYDAFVEREFKESREFLESLIGYRVDTFAYPGGYYTGEMALKGKEVWGYDALFTCNPVRVTYDTSMAEIGRFIIYGNDPADRNFRAATSFHGATGEDLGRQLLGGEIGDDGTPTAPLVVVKPGENETTPERRPIIEIDISKLQGVDPESITMRIPGFGLVPCLFDATAGRIRYRPMQVLRSPEVSVAVRLRRIGEPKDDVISWKFFIDQNAWYLPQDSAVPPATTETGAATTPVVQPGPEAAAPGDFQPIVPKVPGSAATATPKKGDKDGKKH